jgi:hypothetical protein
MQKQNAGPIRALEASFQDMHSETINVVHEAGANSGGNRVLAISHALIGRAGLIGRRSIQKTCETLNMLTPRKGLRIKHQYSLADQKRVCAWFTRHPEVSEAGTIPIIGNNGPDSAWCRANTRADRLPAGNLAAPH